MVLIRAISKMDQTSSSRKIRLVLAGVLSAELRTFINNLSEQERNALHIIDNYLTDQELINAYLNADLVCTPYKDHYSPSGIVLRAMHYNKPVLVPEYHWFKFMVDNFKVGFTVKDLSEDGLATAIIETVKHLDSFPFREKNQIAKRFFDTDNFKAHWQYLILKRESKNLYSFDQCLIDNRKE